MFTIQASVITLFVNSKEENYWDFCNYYVQEFGLGVYCMSCRIGVAGTCLGLFESLNVCTCYMPKLAKLKYFTGKACGRYAAKLKFGRKPSK